MIIEYLCEIMKLEAEKFDNIDNIQVFDNIQESWVDCKDAVSLINVELKCIQHRCVPTIPD